MPVPSSISDLSATPALNSPPGSESPSSIDDYLRTHAAFIRQVSDAAATKATTAYVDAAVAATKQALFPVGSIYTNAANATNPATLLGFGTWSAFGSGRALVGVNAADPLFASAENTGGSKDAIVVAHAHTASSGTQGAHSHISGYGGLYSSRYGAAAGLSNEETDASNGASSTNGAYTSTGGDHTHAITVNSEGASGVNANLQPYITVHMWKRVA